MLTNDIEVDANDILTVTSAPVASSKGATVTVATDGSYTYNPDISTTLNALVAAESTTDIFTYTINDGNGSTSSATVTITVSGINDAPALSDDTATAPSEDVVLTVAASGVLSNDSDFEGNTLTATAFQATSTKGGTIVGTTDGSYTYNPTQVAGVGETTTDTFTYTVNDGLGATSIATVTVTVTGVNDAATATDDVGTTDDNTLLTVAASGVLTNDIDVDANDILTVTAFSAASSKGAAVTVGTDGSYTYNPEVSTTLNNLITGSTIDTFTYTISDGNGSTSNATVTVTVSGINDVPVAVDDSGNTNEDTVLTVAASGVLSNDSDVEGDTLTVTASQATSSKGATVTVTTDGSYTYDPTTSTTLSSIIRATTDTFTYTISDNNSGTDIATVTISLAVASFNLSELNGANGFVINGVGASDQSGLSVSGAGDVNGDGYADVIIGAEYADPNGSASGESYVVFGQASGWTTAINLTDLNGTNGFILNGINANDRSGGSVSNVGDINGDGYDDVIIGAWAADPHGSLSGESYVVFGQASGWTTAINLTDLNGSNGFILNGIGGDDRSGRPVSNAGDVNGDGFDDLIIGARNADPNGTGNAGESYVVFGKATGFTTAIELSNLNGTNGFVINGINGSDVAYTVSSAGDVNGDGYDDLIIGAWAADPHGGTSGESYIVFGKAGGYTTGFNLSELNSTNGFILNGVGGDDRSGRSVSSAGDLNGDGLDDVIIGAYRGDPNGGTSGESYVVFGKTSGYTTEFELSDLNGTNGFVINGIGASDESGKSVSNAGDFNGDGYDDVIIGARLADPNGGASGESYVVFGKAGGFTTAINLSDLNGSNGFVINGIGGSDQSGTSVSGAGDIDGDGFDDVIIGAPLADPNGGASGESYTIFGFDTAGEITQSGTAGADTLTGTSGADFIYGDDGNDVITGLADDDILIGGLGDDTLDGGAGNDVLKGAAGDDVIVYDSADVLGVDGGSGIDTLRVDGTGVSLSLTTVNTTEYYSLYQNIEVIDLTGSGNNTLTLTALDVIHMSNSPASMETFSGSDSFSHVLRVDGNSGDVVDLNGSWGFVGEFIHSGNSNTYYEYIDTNGGAVLQVQSTLTRLDFPPTAYNDVGGTTDDNTTLTVAASGVLTNDTDVDSDTLTVTGFSAASAKGAAVVVGTDGSYTFDPDVSTTLNSLAATEVTTDTFTYTINDGTGGTSSATVTITISGVNDAPALTDDSVIAPSEDAVLTVAASGVLSNDSDFEGNTLTATAFEATSTKGALVSGTTDGSYTYDPTAVASFQPIAVGETTTDTFTYTVNDGLGATSIATVTVTVSGTNETPTATNDVGGTTDDNTILTVAASGVLTNDTDVDTSDTLTVTAFSAASSKGATVTVATDGSYTYNPDVSTTLNSLAATESTTDTFTYTINDGNGGTSSATVTITVSGINDAPALTDDTATAPSEDAVLTVAASGVLSNDSDFEGNALTATAFDATSTKGGTIVGATDGSYTYNPTQVAGVGETTTDTFTYTVNDGLGATSIATVTVTVSGANDAPTASNDVGTTDDNTILTVAASGVLTNDTDVDASDILTVTSASAASSKGAAVTVGTDGSYTYTPDASATLNALVAAESTTDTFTYTINDGNGGTSSATVTITVSGTNDPIALDDTGISVNNNVAFTFAASGVLTNDSDLESDTLTVTSTTVTSSKGAIVVFTTDGGYTYNAQGSTTLEGVAPETTDTFVYTISDGNSGTDSATVTVDVARMNLDMSLLDGTNGFALNATQAVGDMDRVSNGGDINGDGFDDVIVGEYRASANGVGQNGKMHVIFGQAGGWNSEMYASDLNGTNGFTINGINDGGSNAGRALSTGDINGDGYDDITIGIFEAEPGGQGTGAYGQTYVVFGKASFNAEFDLTAVNGTNGFLFTGIDLGDRLGVSVDSAGDINGDGYDDVVVGAEYGDPNSNSNAGEAYVVFGKAGGWTTEIDLNTLNGTNGFILNGIDVDDNLRSGDSVDINGDGYDDVFIAARLADPNSQTDAGEAYIVFGKADGWTTAFDLSDLNGTNGFIINGIDAYDIAGLSLSKAGDVNGDGFVDIIIGALWADPNGDNSGESYVVFGKASGFGASFDLSDLNGTNGFIINGIGAGDFAGRVGSAGDFNGDGYDDVIIGAESGDPNGQGGAGEAYIVFGKASGWTTAINLSDLNGTNGLLLNGIEAGDLAGRGINSAGDVNGDGFDDVVIGAHTGDIGGQVYTVFGFDTADEITQSGTSGADTLTGTSGVDFIYGDAGNDVLNGLADADILIGGLGDDTLDGGAGNDVLKGAGGDDVIVYDSADVLEVDGGSGIDTLRIDGSGVSLNLTTVNTTEYYSLYENIEVVDLTGSGNNTLTLTALDLIHISDSPASMQTFSGSDTFNHVLRVDGNSGDKVVVSGSWTFVGQFAHNTNSNVYNEYIDSNSTAVLQVESGLLTSGLPAVAFLNLSELNGINGFILNGSETAGQLGDISDGGDINGDGYNDVVVAEHRADANGVGGNGRIYVVYGQAGGWSTEIDASSLNGTNGFIINGINDGGSNAGRALSTGDINGDGYDDVTIGIWEGGASSIGATYVVFGQASFSAEFDLSTVNGTNGFAINGLDAVDRLGWSVNGTGDINGDGYDDVIVGATYGDPNGNSNAGESYVVFGKASGWTAEFDPANLNGTNGFILNGIDVDDNSGFKLSSIGNFNGDGYDDLMITAPSVNGNTGDVYVVYGKASGWTTAIDLSDLNGTNGFVIKGVVATNNAGYHADSAGDFNGDGFDDVIFTGAGNSYVVYGQASGFTAAFNLSDINGTNGFVIEQARTFGEAGDFNGDGYDDLIMGSGFSDPNGQVNAGISYILFGKASGFTAGFDLNDLNGINGFVINGIDSDDNSGQTVDVAGDIDGDGFDDLIIGAKFADPNGLSNAGEAYTVFGFDNADNITQAGTSGADTLIGTSGVDFIYGDDGNDVLTGAADADILIGGRGDDTLDGGAGNDVLKGAAGDDVLVYDSTDVLEVDGGSGIDTLRIDGSGVSLNLTTVNTTEYYSLYENIEVVDLTGSGNNTLTLTALDLIHMSDSLPSMQTFRSSDSFNHILRVDGNAGDVLNAGLGWTFVGSFVHSGNGNTYHEHYDANGSVVLQIQDTIDFAIQGMDLSDLNGTNGFVLNGIDAGDWLRRVDGAGDINGDGYADVIVGAPQNGTGEAYVVFGKAGGWTTAIDLSDLNGTNGFILNGVTGSDRFGGAVSSAGDINGDGYDDVIIAARYGDPNGINSGESYVVFGKASGFAAAINVSELNGTDGFVFNGIDAYDQGGRQVDNAGDVNGDGFDDMILSAPNGDPNGIDTGEYYVVFGKASGYGAAFELSDLDGTNGFILNGIYAADVASNASAVSGAGDINGDGYDDVIMAVSNADPNGSNSGQSYVVFGQASGFAGTIELSDLNGTNGFILNGIDAADISGVSVSDAGDINGDGFDDVIIAAAHADPNGLSNAGESYVVFGKASGFAGTVELSDLNGTNGFVINAIDDNDRIRVVGSAGDFNGDGYDDVIIGAFLADPHGIDTALLRPLGSACAAAIITSSKPSPLISPASETLTPEISAASMPFKIKPLVPFKSLNSIVPAKPLACPNTT